MSYTRPGYFFPCRPALRPNSLLNSGGEGWIRTNVGVSQQIYSLPPLATRAPLRRELAIMGPSSHPVKRSLMKSRDFEHWCSHPYTASSLQWGRRHGASLQRTRQRACVAVFGSHKCSRQAELRKVGDPTAGLHHTTTDIRCRALAHRTKRTQPALEYPARHRRERTIVRALAG